MSVKHLVGIVAVMLLACLECSAEAQPERVDAEQLCAVKRAVRFQQRAWTPRECERIAAALNETAEPVQMLAMAIWESDLRENAIRTTLRSDGMFAHDMGLLAVRCITDREAVCTNGEAKGLVAIKLTDPAVNIRTAAAVLASHGGRLNGFNGCVERKGRKCRYAENIAVLVSAFGGVEVKTKGARLRKLSRQIVEAIGKERKS